FAHPCSAKTAAQTREAAEVSWGTRALKISSAKS
ncbi:hypothetical protein TGRUB_248590B, partial [Toxoplasma gondii RUB]